MDKLIQKDKEIEILKKKLKNVQRSKLRIKHKLNDTLKQLNMYKSDVLESTWDIN